MLEGYIDERGLVEPEGPYGEFLGYYGGVKNNPVFHLTAITHRRDALFQTASISGRLLACTDTAQLGALRSEVIIWNALETAVREPRAIYCHARRAAAITTCASRCASACRAKRRTRSSAVFGCLANVKNVFVVDPDIDIFSDDQMDWALATRFQADRDLVVHNGMRALPLDPSLDPGKRIGAKAGFDLTVAFGRSGMESLIPEVPTYGDRRFPSIRAALEDGPKRFEELIGRRRQPRRPRDRVGARAPADGTFHWPRCVRQVHARKTSMSMLKPNPCGE